MVLRGFLERYERFTLLDHLRTRIVDRLYVYQRRVFDFRYRVATGGATYTEIDTFHADTENWPYLGCQWPDLWFVLKDLKHEGTFVDLGCGKGKALLIAGMLQYQRVIGVEISSELAAAARHNINQFRGKRRAGTVECVAASVTDWMVPDDASAVFLFNPFFGETFKMAMANVFASYDRHPREMHIVYEYPWEHEWLLSTGRVKVDSVRAEAWPKLPRWWTSEHVTITYHVTGVNQPTGRCSSRVRRLSAIKRKMLERWSRPGENHFDIESISTIHYT